MNSITEQKLREALAFYADPANWSGIGLHNAMLMDQGKVARDALTQTAQPEIDDRAKRQSDYLDALAASTIPTLIREIHALQNRVTALENNS